jgi:hypothetical protein
LHVTIAQVVPVFPLWKEPEGVALRDTLIVALGRGERPRTEERFDRRGYCVRVVGDPTFQEDQVTREVSLVVDDPCRRGRRRAPGAGRLRDVRPKLLRTEALL